MKVAALFVLTQFFWVESVLAGSIKVSGSSTIRPIVMDASKVFKKKEGVRVKVKGGGSSTGVKNAKAGKSDIGAVSRHLKDSEKEGMVATLIGKDGIAIIVNSKNSVKGLTSDQVAKIYTGQIKNWKEVGGKDQKIVLEALKEGHSTKGLFEKHFKIKGKVSKDAFETDSNREGLTYVSQTEGAIGYVSIGAASGAKAKGTTINLLKLDGVEASNSTVAGGSYPLTRELNLVTKGEPAGDTKKFLDFLLSAEGQKIVEKKDFVPVTGH